MYETQAVVNTMQANVLCTCTSCCQRHWDRVVVLCRRTECYFSNRPIITGCALRNALPLPKPGIEVVRGHQARQELGLTVASVPMKDMLKGLGSAHKDARYVTAGGQRLYMVFSYLLDMSVNSYRRQFVASPDGKTKYCYFERVLISHPKKHHYVCKAADSDQVLFTLERSGPKDLEIAVRNGYQPTLRVKCQGGTLRWIGEGGEAWNCGHIQEREIRVEPYMDQLLMVTLSAIIRDIASVSGLLKAAEMAAPKPMAGAGGIAMRGANYIVTSEPGQRQAPNNREEMAMQMANDLVRSRKIRRDDGDSGYGSAMSSRSQSVAAPSCRRENRSRSNSSRRPDLLESVAQHPGVKRPDLLRAADSVVRYGADMYSKQKKM